MNNSLTGLRQIAEWDEDYVSSLPVDEFDWLEYKGSDKFANSAWTHEMSKYVSAWANYDGGYIVFGVENPQSGEHRLLLMEECRKRLSRGLVIGLTL